MTSPIKKKDIGVIVEQPRRALQEGRGRRVASTRIKNLCFRYASQSGLTISIDDVKTPPEKKEILDGHEKDAEKVETQFRRGIITDGERRQKEVEIWTRPPHEVQDAMERLLKAEKFNPIDMMVGSGARGNMMQVRQIAGMRGLVANPRGDMIPRPIKSNFREGLSMLEYFIATPGARKGLVDTALRTADSGYLTRRLVDVAQELIIREEDCGEATDARHLGRGRRARHRRQRRSATSTTKLLGRSLITTDSRRSPTAPCSRLGLRSVDGTRRARCATTRHVDRVRVRSSLTCEAELGICGTCYGLSLATGKDDRARRGRRRHRRPVDR